MTFRLYASAAALLLLSGTVTAAFVPFAPAFAQQSAAMPVSSSPPTDPAALVDPADWLYAGSDIPRDEGWTFGTLANGLRYAVRENGAPPGQVAVRVRIGAGSLMEKDGELGFAHFIEHLSFRGSREFSDGDTKRLWQRLGVAFGSDSNAATTPTDTVYKLDIPSATPAGLDESMRVLASMIEEPNLDATTVASERGVVKSELREYAGPAARIGDAVREHVFAGQLLAKRPTIGTNESLDSATAVSLQAFHDRWYRPDNIVIAIAGDGDPANYAALIDKYFSDWSEPGTLAYQPQFGDPVPAKPVARIVYEPTQPNYVSLSYLRPWRRVTDSIAYTQTLYHDAMALRIINRRLEDRARQGGSYVVAQVSEDKVSRSADNTTINIVPVGGDWQAALNDVRGVVADALARAPSQAEIDREYDELDALMTREVENAQNQAGSELVDDLMGSVDIGETVSDPVHHRILFRSSRPLATPEETLAVTRKLFSGKVVRAFMTTPTKPAADAEATLARLATQDIAADGSSRLEPRDVSIDDLPSLGKPGTIVQRAIIPAVDVENMTLSNGVTALVLDNQVEPDKIRVRVRFGGGRRALSPTANNLLWTGDLALVESGVGDLDLRDLESLTNGRLLGLNFDIEDGAFEFNAETNAADFADQLRLIAAKLDHPNWDPAPVKRARVVQQTAFDASTGSPIAVINRSLESELHPGDKRFAPPSRAEIDALTPKAFRDFWTPRLASGPIELIVFGDLSKVDEDAVIAATLGALKPRKPIATAASAALSFPKSAIAPKVLRHSGDANQSAAVLSWQTGGGIADIREARQLDVLAAIFNDRLFDRLRAEQGASYSPSVGSNWSTDFDSGSYLMAASLVRPEDIGAFFGYARDIAKDLRETPVGADELARSVTPIKELIYRASSGNVFFMNQVEGATREPRKISALRNYVLDTTSTTPADIQRLAQKYLSNDGASLVVLPEGVALSSVWRPGGGPATASASGQAAAAK